MFLADIVKGFCDVLCVGDCACDVADSGQWTSLSLPPLSHTLWSSNVRCLAYVNFKIYFHVFS